MLTESNHRADTRASRLLGLAHLPARHTLSTACPAPLPAARRACPDAYGLAEDGAYLGGLPFRIGRRGNGSTGLDAGGSRPGHLLGGWAACQTAGVPPHRDIAAFEERAPGYEHGWRGRLHHDIAGRAAQLAVSVHAAPRRVLDVGCGTGYLLRLLARRCPQATELAGLDPAPSMIAAAQQAADDRRLRFTVGAAERCPTPMAPST